jgi:coiled-coil domain-containing protein 130
MQGFNMGRYIPPASQDPSLSSNKVGGFNSQKGHPLGSRFSKAKQGLITVRFEMPFDVWCESCKPEFLIKQGIRFNAEKKKVGKYLTSPIWEFSFRHPPCSGIIAIRTDPEKTQYVVAAGGRKKAGAPTTALDKDYGEILTEEERERRRNDAFAHLEGQNEEKIQAKTDGAQLKRLYEAQSRHWDDPYTANQRLRRDFRVGRNQREAAAMEKQEIAERYGLGLALLDHTQEDADRAALVEYGVVDGTPESALAKPMFVSQKSPCLQERPKETTKAQWKQQQTTKLFQESVVSSTKAKMNPFGDETVGWNRSRKKADLPSAPANTTKTPGSKRSASPLQEFSTKSMKLVAYDESEDESLG